MTNYLLVFLGGGIGAMLRHGVNRASLAWPGNSFPTHTMLVNVTGSLAIGLLAGWFAFRAAHSSQALELFLITGILGGFTTFSAFSLDAMLLWERGQSLNAFAYVLGSVLISILAVSVGMAAMRVTR